MYHLLLWHQPRIALEIGVEAGTASAYMAMAAQTYDGMVIGIDLNDFSHKPGNNYYFIKGDSTTITVFNKVFHFVQEIGPVGVVYQDSSHHYLESIKEWELYSQLLGKDAIWICDDITPAFHDPKIDPPGKGMVQYFEQLPGDKRLFPMVLHRGNTQGIILTNGK